MRPLPVALANRLEGMGRFDVPLDRRLETAFNHFFFRD
jgi:hypothetical protein